MTTTFDRPFSAADVLSVLDKFAELQTELDLTTVCAGDLRAGMTIVERVNRKRRYFLVHGHPIHKGHEVYITVTVNGHRLNWRYEHESLVHITGGN